ncbi:Adenylate and Guanylate cyclase catalytic domain [Carpediemonas membranifera]|uniref:Adenylate and Guanylate cyclase catalytic domain n=1 Tax=Carpediemonas membranifera TaxID=201153 RepID=A0A8J6AVC5_9EUKA|nr:Adenylate and Guanylate cyclase catalytic domain [Carpediemonas membranifera]|eukprot:KAG9395716.1 Adenylate and Guanylate cyclase catalytic domain [Carpediemonas membranifera]
MPPTTFHADVRVLLDGKVDRFSFDVMRDQLDVGHITISICQRFQRSMDITTCLGQLSATTLHIHYLLQRNKMEDSTTFFVREVDSSSVGAPGLKCASASSTNADTHAAIEACALELSLRMGSCSPNFIFMSCHSDHDPEAIRHAMNQVMPDVKFLGVSNCETAMTEDIIFDGMHLTMFALSDGGDIAINIAEKKPGRMSEIAYNLSKQVCKDAGKNPDTVHLHPPSIVMLYNTLGEEKDTITGIQACFGRAVPVVGGSAYFQMDGSSKGWVVVPSASGWNSIVIVAMWTECEVMAVSRYGFSPSAISGVITKVGEDSHVIQEIDNQPATHVYSSWTADALDDEVKRSDGPETCNVSWKTVLHPLGKMVGFDSTGDEVMQLTHVLLFLPNGGGLKTAVEHSVGERLMLMSGTTRQVVNRVFAVHRPVQERFHTVHGGLLEWCCGILSATRDQLPMLQRHFKTICRSSLISHFPMGEIATFRLNRQMMDATSPCDSCDPFGAPCEPVIYEKTTSDTSSFDSEPDSESDFDEEMAVISPNENISCSFSQFAVDVDSETCLTQFCNLSFNLIVFGESQSILPTGEVTLLFTDIMSSTDLWKSDSRNMARAVHCHNDVLRDLLQTLKSAWPGTEMKFEGDAFMIAFSSPIHCALFCAVAQLALMQADWPEIDHPDCDTLRTPIDEDRYCATCAFAAEKGEAPLPHCCTKEVRRSSFQYRGLRIRMGFHTGRPKPTFDAASKRADYIGMDVNLATRIADSGHGGQILLSGQTYEQIKNEDFTIVGGVEFKRLGRFALWGLEAQEIYEMRLPWLSMRDFTGLPLRGAERLD